MPNMRFLITLSLSLTANAFQVLESIHAADLGYTKRCTDALQTDIECDKNAWLVGKGSHQGWVGSNRIADAVCTATCSKSLQNWNETISGECADDRNEDRNEGSHRQLESWITEANERQQMWNATCIKDTKSGRYCLDIMDELHDWDDRLKPYQDLCHPCYGMVITALLNSSTEVHMWELDDDYWKGQLKLVHENCSSRGKIQEYFEAQKLFNTSHSPNRSLEAEHNDSITLIGNRKSGMWVAALIYGMGIFLL